MLIETEAEAEVVAVPAPSLSATPDHPAAAMPGAPSMVDTGPPSCAGPYGIRYDFNYGCRVQVPAGDWRVRLTDIEADVVLFDEIVNDGTVNSLKKYFVRFRIEVLRGDECVFEHDYDAAGQQVYMRLPVGTLGDIIAWFPYVDEFRKKHRCKMLVSMGKDIWTLFAACYPELHYVAPEDESTLRPQCYASYFLGIFFPCDDRTHQPTDFRVSGLQKTIPFLLGLAPVERRPRIAIEDPTRRITEPYVVIAAQSSSQCKYWNHPTGWYELIKQLKAMGYRVLCIDRQHAHGEKLLWNLIPYGSEDFTGDLPLQERVSLLHHADFFIGLSSGLSWLAWALHKPVVVISGFTHPHNEFETAYRVINFHACNSCWNDTGVEFNHGDFAWCPRHAGTERQFECSRLITPRQVIRTVETLMTDLDLDPRRGPERSL
ncbi:autotransporter strand-loop-strand O-heptosyltransferase [Paraburkholderia phenazinium]|uniref:Autotransporter strand-loop-strand O-heptosyltransferase n=1 Tax=Paraburkholderia phenazinium TaxID=60549 RepID=A0A1N6J7T4_9BURK|nr:autotransporter strand-loop-strand O-heptosyltransferase [Paraburkholderia phenazinium]SIO40166.1 autotransporter strand-loop-strand O-heptosyltransferase [Paraburkholderia phenazinium]